MKKELMLVGLLLIVLVLLYIDFGKLLETLAGANPALFLLAVALCVPALMARSAKWHFMLRRQGCRLPFLKSFKYYFIGVGLGAFTPGRLGDFAKALFVNREIKSLSKSFSSVLVDRVVDLSVLVFLGIVSSIAFVLFFGVTVISAPIIIAMLAALALGFYLLFNKELLKKVLKPFYRVLVPERFKERLAKGFDEFIRSVQGLLKSPGMLVVAAFFSLLSWLIAALSYYSIGLALGIGLSPAFLLLVVALSTLVLLLPVSFSGIGTRDALMILLFSLQGISAEKAVAFSFLILFSSLIIAFTGLALVGTEKLELKKFLGGKNWQGWTPGGGAKLGQG